MRHFQGARQQEFPERRVDIKKILVLQVAAGEFSKMFLVPNNDSRVPNARYSRQKSEDGEEYGDFYAECCWHGTIVPYSGDKKTGSMCFPCRLVQSEIHFDV